MDEWQPVRELIRARYSIARETADALDLVFAFDGGVVRQGVRVTLVRAMGVTGLRLASIIGRRILVDPTWALEHNATLVLGAVTFQGEEAVFQASLPLAGLAEDDLIRALVAVPHEAARLREGGARGAGGPTMFA